MLKCSIVISRVHSNLQNVRKLSLQTCKTKHFPNTLNLFHISEGQRPHVKKFGTNRRGSKASQQQLFLKPVWTIFISWLSPHTTLFCCCCLFFYLLTILCTPFQLLLFSKILYTINKVWIDRGISISCLFSRNCLNFTMVDMYRWEECEICWNVCCCVTLQQDCVHWLFMDEQFCL